MFGDALVLGCLGVLVALVVFDVVIRLRGRAGDSRFEPSYLQCDVCGTRPVVRQYLWSGRELAAAFGDLPGGVAAPDLCARVGLCSGCDADVPDELRPWTIGALRS